MPCASTTVAADAGCARQKRIDARPVFLLSKTHKNLPLQSRVPDSQVVNRQAFSVACCCCLAMLRQTVALHLPVVGIDMSYSTATKQIPLRWRPRLNVLLQVAEKVVYEYVSAPLTFGKPQSSTEEPDLGQDEAGPSGLGRGAEGATRGGLGSVGGIGWAPALCPY